jgi:hypothetical protein
VNVVHLKIPLLLRRRIALLQTIARLLDVAVEDEQVVGVALRVGEVVRLPASA